MTGTLFVVATPIGNLQDITFRAVKILQTVDAIACEDTRKTGILLAQIAPTYEVGRSGPRRSRLISYYEQNELQRIPEIVAALKDGLSIALVSDAGTPTISDPGFKLVRECIAQGVKIESIPGPSSVISALVSSGLPTDKFTFVGYPPKKPGHRKKLFEDLKNLSLKTTIILFEGPHHLIRTLEGMREVFGNIDIVICRELTKIYEEIRREKLEESILHFSKTTPKGEFVVLFNFAPR